MARQSDPVLPRFSSRLAYVLAAVGMAVGLGNVWRFPYEAGENGGAAFVVVYLVGLAVVATPIFLCEALIGRRGAASPPTALERQAVEHGRSRAWRIPGLVGVVANLLVMSFYSVIAGWTLHYLLTALSGGFTGLTAQGALTHFDALQASVPSLLLWQGLFIVFTMIIVGLGVNRGIERGMRLMMPLLGLLLLFLVGFALIEGDGMRAARYLFAPDFSKLTPQVALAAIGQAFFSVSVGLGGVMMYSAYLPRDTSIPRATAYIVGADTAVALLAGLAIFPIVFAHGLDPAGGPGLIFVTLPLAFAAIPGGALLGFVFFLFLFIAALTSAVALYEPTAAYLGEHGVPRWVGVGIAAVTSWLLGLLSVFSFNLWQEMAMTPFEIITAGINHVVLPLGALVSAYFAGRLLSRQATIAELGLGDGWLYRSWRFAVRWLTPALILVLFAANLFL